MQKLILLFIGIFSLNLSFSQSGLFNFNENSYSEIIQPQRIVKDKGLEGIIVNYSFVNASVYSENIQGYNYKKLFVKDFSHLQEVGKPAMPSHIDFIAVPEGADYTITQTFSGLKTEKTSKLYPALKPARDTYGATEPKFEMDENFYLSDIKYPANPIQIVDVVYIKGIKMLMVQICPFQYNPSKQELYSFENISYEIKFSKATHFVKSSDFTSYAIDMASRFPLNGNSLYIEKTQNPSKSGTNDRYDYIIITKNTYLAAADSLAKWKQQLGYTVEIVSAASWTVNSVKNAIHTRYQNWSPKPDYFVILGDHQDVPAEIFYETTNNDPYGTDLYYACMDGANDYLPDMARGRISVSNANEASVVVQKIINYERNPISDTNFYKKGVNCAQFQDDDLNGYADRRFVHTSEDVRNYLLNKNYQVQRIYYTDNNIFPTNYNSGYYSNGQSIPSDLSKLNGYAWNGGATDIQSAINSGAFYLLHRDHGFVGGSGWSRPYFVLGNISPLTNGTKLPVVFSINCHTGEFTLPICFSESFLRKANGGAVGVFGASYYSYSGYNDGLAAGFFDAIWSNPGLTPAFGSGATGSSNYVPHQDILTMGDVLNHGLTRMIQTWGGNSNEIIYQFRLFHYFGDPAMKIWKSLPLNITATHSSSVSCADTAFAITNCSLLNATATLMSNGILLGRTTLVNGSGFIPLNGVQGNTAKLTISGSGYRPYIANINVTAGGTMGVSAIITHIKCKSELSGKIKLLPSCGVEPYSYIWSTGDTIDYIQNKAAGVYFVTITDNNQTSIVDTFVVTEPLLALGVSESISHVKCFYESNGKIILNPIGGQIPYTFLWNGGSTSSVRSNLAAGNYTVTTTDNAGCSIIKNYTITQPTAIVLNTVSVDDVLNNCSGSATVNVQGGITPYAFLWDDPNHQTTSIATGLCAGNYKIIVTDSNNCLKYRSVYINNTIGMEENLEDFDFNAYPNPSKSGMFTLDFPNLITQNLEIEIYNSIGQKIHSEELNASANCVINLQNYSGGLYFLQLKSANAIIGKKVLIKE